MVGLVSGRQQTYSRVSNERYVYWIILDEEKLRDLDKLITMKYSPIIYDRKTLYIIRKILGVKYRFLDRKIELMIQK